MFTKPTKSQKRLRLALIGASGSGKTYSALSIASHLGTRIGVIDTERGSSVLYCDDFDFEMCQLDDAKPQAYIDAIKAATQFDVLIIDSFSHAWYEILEMAGGRFENWARVRPIERQLIKAILDCPAHVIVTMRSKSEYVVELVENRSGKMTNQPRKIGTVPIQARDIEFEFDIAGLMDADHNLTIDSTRLKAIDREVFPMPGEELATILKAWLTDGASIPETAQQKADRVGAAMKAKGITKPQVLELLKEFDAESPRTLTSEQVDELIEMM
jgi:ABC-type dipeptide/oligopeptide/nickel transport system ATPase component